MRGLQSPMHSSQRSFLNSFFLASFRVHLWSCLQHTDLLARHRRAAAEQGRDSYRRSKVTHTDGPKHHQTPFLFFSFSSTPPGHKHCIEAAMLTVLI